MAQPKRKETEAEAASPEASKSSTPASPPAPSLSLSPRGWAVLIGVILIANIPVLHRFLIRGAQPVTATVPLQEDFSSTPLGTQPKDWWTTGGQWRVVNWNKGNNELLAPGPKNNPLWLQASLPRDVAVDFDVRSESPEGDIKCEIFGDGLNHASGYILIHGGWNNSLSIIARLDEHGTSLAQLEQMARQRANDEHLPNSDVVATGVFKADTRMRKEANPYPVQIGRTYHWRIERKGAVIKWFIDNQLFMDFTDPFPLEGKGHDRFGFSSWEANLFFDNLKIEPL
ncbi:MAG: hypothetical protein ACJ790_19270 [Myxococcaceae bacterium]